MFKRSTTPHRLESIPLFAHCTRRELDTIDGALTEVRLDAGQVLAREGWYGNEVVVVAEGELAVTRGEDGRRVAVLGAGEVVGELALLDGTPRTATVTAQTPAVVFVANAREFAVLMSVPSVATAIEAAADHRREANRAA